MRGDAIFLNGVYRAVLEDILKVQEHLPDQVMFLQPYAKDAIVRLRDNPPAAEDPVELYLSFRRLVTWPRSSGGRTKPVSLRSDGA